MQIANYKLPKRAKQRSMEKRAAPGAARRAPPTAVTTARDLLATLQSPLHEARLAAFFILERQFQRGDESVRKSVFLAYRGNMAQVNNWDLVDSSAPSIVGGWLFDKNRSWLHKLSRSENLWQRRIAILATLHFIRKEDFDDTLRLAETLLRDEHDLIHKAVGWMLREMGKRNPVPLRAFLDAHHAAMPRTMLRYAIERLPERERKQYLAGKRS